MAYFPTPYDFDQVMSFLGILIDGNPYYYTYTTKPTDAASYAANMIWQDTKTQPTWAYVSSPSGAGWLLYNAWYQNAITTTCAQVDSALASINATIPAAQVQSDWNASSGKGVILNKPSLAMVATSGNYADLSNKPAAIPARSQSVQSRTLNSSFQVSTLRDTLANYSIQIAATLSLTTGQTGSASLQISSDNITFTEIARVTNGQTGSLTVGLNLVQTTISALHGYIPAGYYAKIVTSGTATTAYITGQELSL